MALTEFLVWVRTTVPRDLAVDDWRAVVAAERIRGAELRDAGIIAQIWRLPSTTAIENVGVWRAEDEAALRQAIDSLPARAWMHVEIRALERHPLSGE
ncbi:muconolactone Delta-isomerase [Microbacterium resistens]